MAELHEKGIADIHAGLAAREFSAAEVAEAAVARIEALDYEKGGVNAFLEFTPEMARKAAAAVDEALAAGKAPAEIGPLAGVPMAYKDNMNLLGTRTTCASRMLEDYESMFTATCVQRTLDAGALPMGKLNMDEFAFGSSTETSAFGPTRNPWDLERVPGGSSGGSAAAVAAGFVPAALGSDTGGSIRQPASFCGVIGVKPTYGVVSRYGVVAFGSSLDQVGPFARSVEDAAYVMNALAGHDPLDCTSQPVTTDFTANLAEGAKGLRVGVVPAFLEAEGLTAEVKARVEEAIKHLQAAGAQLVEVDLPNAQAAMSAYYVLGPCEAFSNLSRFDSVRYGYCDAGHKDLGGQYEASRSKGFGPEARRRIMLGSYLLSAGVYDKYYYPAQQVRTLITADYRQAYGKCDVIVLPSSPRTAFKFGEISDPTSMYLSDMFTISLNIAGNGGMSMPCGLGADTGLPIGVQLQSPQFKDENMFRAAAVLEQVYGKAPIAPRFAPGATAASGSAAAAAAASDPASATKAGE